MLVFLNGEFVPEERAVVSVFDRGFLYGDGLFEAVLVRNGKPFRWGQHLERLHRGADFLKIKQPFAPAALRDFAGQLIVRNQKPDALLRLSLSRGVCPRGYSVFGYEPRTLTKLQCSFNSLTASATLRSCTWPSQSMKKKYSHAFRLLGRDSILVMLMP
jgi:branched-subunit amino acid aminotransferase/4-amino-4-deoxychorismate lyase